MRGYKLWVLTDSAGYIMRTTMLHASKGMPRWARPQVLRPEGPLLDEAGEPVLDAETGEPIILPEVRGLPDGRRCVEVKDRRQRHLLRREALDHRVDKHGKVTPREPIEVVAPGVAWVNEPFTVRVVGKPGLTAHFSIGGHEYTADTGDEIEITWPVPGRVGIVLNTHRQPVRLATDRVVDVRERPAPPDPPGPPGP